MEYVFFAVKLILGAILVGIVWMYVYFSGYRAGLEEAGMGDRDDECD